MKSLAALSIAVLGISFLGGCFSRTSNEFLLATTDLNDVEHNLEFYRVTVSTKATNTRTLYQTGFYQADILHNLFGDVRDPEKGATVSGESAATLYAVEEGMLKPLMDRRFTVIYGANADAISTQIKLAAENEDTGKAFGRLLAATAVGPDLHQAIEVEKQVAAETAINAKLAAELEALATKMDAASTSPTVNLAAARKEIILAAEVATKVIAKPQNFDEGAPDDALKAIAGFRDTLK